MPVTYDSVQEGDVLPSLQRTPTSEKVDLFQTLALGPAATDPARSARMGLRAPVVPSSIKHAYLQLYLNQWLNGVGKIRRLQFSNRKPDYQEETITFGGTITRKYEEAGQRFLDLEVSIMNEQNEQSVRGSATVQFNDPA